ncbi:alpha/beta fold hydrolase [Amycolatopsis thermophila]|uniref:Pimeloyl-ACP methyl ester carboxylesterase n=1 Tax=Amycolatopsis thermophila TaxID=206084 RepID=A0ABU0EZE9_9PSEU|nr:alpha/beta fold hydrolase [Amycolatopsis thermophila]MDQ0380689.1 pimeloyl-ACP methyl ester carboxylesterase [Amycolatopsis thermophila]
MVRRVVSRDGTRIAVAEAGDAAAPVVVCVHGYPDDRSVWDGVAALLAQRFHVVTYDVRGAGESDRPRRRDGYRLERLTEDLEAVLAAVSPGRPVHLLAHDWGSIQCWHAVTSDALRGRIASFTSISGPSLDHAGDWFRGKLRRPSGWAPALRQLVHSTYIVFFQIPLVPELGWRSGAGQRVLARLSGPSVGRPRVADAVHGLELYRANVGARLSRPRPRAAEIPVQVLAPLGDPYVTPALQTEVGRWAPRLWVRRLPGGHWIPRERPDVIARCAAELVEHVEGAPESRGLRRARTGGFELVVVTSASRFARACAAAFAGTGAEVVTAGPLPDAEAVAAFAKDVRERHGVPDVVVDSHGAARVFAEQMAEHGEGGCVVLHDPAEAQRLRRAFPGLGVVRAGDGPPARAARKVLARARR